MIYDIAIIGGGAAGLCAAIYAARANMNVIVFEGTGFGGQVNYTSEVDNYLGFSSISGAELAAKMREHAQRFCCTFKSENIRAIADAFKSVKKLVTRSCTYEARTVILATGAKPRKLGVPGEEEFSGAGVSYCATCDGAFFREKQVIVAGGGNTAFEDALYLASFCKKVTLLNRSDKFRAAASLVDKARENPVIEIRTNSKIEKIQGSTKVVSAVISNTQNGRIGVLDTDAVFVAAGRIPESGLLKSIAALAEDESVITDEHMQTSVSGIFAAGDVRKTPLRQIITAAADGAVAAEAAIAHIRLS